MSLVNVAPPPQEVIDTDLIYLNTLTWNTTSVSGSYYTYYAVVQDYGRKISNIMVKGWGSCGDLVIPFITSTGAAGLWVKNKDWINNNSYVGLRITFA